MAACGGRGVPSTFPGTSPASASAPEARPAIVTAAIDSEPPLPGETTPAGWPGLGGAPAGGMNMGGMHHMHGMHMDMPDGGAPPASH